MSNIQIESDLKEIFNKFEQKLDKLDGKLDKLSEDVTILKVGQAEIKGDIKTLDEKLFRKNIFKKLKILATNDF